LTSPIVIVIQQAKMSLQHTAAVCLAIALHNSNQRTEHPSSSTFILFWCVSHLWFAAAYELIDSKLFLCLWFRFWCLKVKAY